MTNKMPVSDLKKYCEEAILGLLLSYPEYYAQIAERITPEHFANEANREFYEFIKASAESDKGWDFSIFLDQFPEKNHEWAMNLM